MTREEIEKGKAKLQRIEHGERLLSRMEQIDHLVLMHQKHGGILKVKASSAQFDAHDIELDREAKADVLDVLKRQKGRLEREFGKL